jgi:flagellar biosynthetic protein FliP
MTQTAANLLAQPTLGSPVDLLVALFVLALVPVLAISVTSFTRIVVVLGLLPASLGTAAMPPNAVIVALAIMLSGAIMAPTLAAIERDAVVPYQTHRISASQALGNAEKPLHAFMARQTRLTDVRAFVRITRIDVSRATEVPFFVLAPAFLVSELRTAFAMGFVLALPFAAIDIVVAIVLMSLGMFMVSPNAISLPIKLLLFVMVDGWTLVVGALAAAYR